MSENMVNLPDSLYEDYSKLKLTSPSNASSSSSAPPPRLSVVAHPTVEMIIQWVCDIHKPKSYMSDFALHNLAYVSATNTLRCSLCLIWFLFDLSSLCLIQHAFDL